MADDFKNFLSNGGTMKLLEWLFRGLIIAIIFWMRSEFATKDQYQADQSKSMQQLMEIGRTLQRVDDKLDENARSSEDHEKRIRNLEAHNGTR